MRILWASNSPIVGSGYGVQSALFGPRIAAEGHHLSFYSNWGHQGACLNWNGFNIYPADGHWGNRTMVACAAHHGDGLDQVLTICLCDAWVLEHTSWPAEFRIALWAPVDQEPLPRLIRQRLAHPSATPIAMSLFGQRMMRDAGLDPLYVPHGVDTNLFRPLDDAERHQARSDFSIPEDAFVVGMVAANQSAPVLSRKAFPQVFQAFARFREEHPDAFLYVHTNELPQDEKSGINLRALAKACEIPARAVRFTEQFAWDLGVKREDVARLVGAFDVLANPSFGEGFGIPIVEAQAAGVPVIVNDWTSMPELCGAGWLVDGDPWYNAPHDAWFKAPRVTDIAQALETAYTARHDQELGAQARQFALGYDANLVMEKYWKPALQTLERPQVREIGPLNAREVVAA